MTVTVDNPQDVELTISLGVNIKDAHNLTNHTVRVGDLNRFIAEQTTLIGDIDPSIRTLSDWTGLSQKARDHIKVLARYITAGTIAGPHRASEHILYVALAILDIDSGDMSQHEIAELFLGHYAVYYQTASSTPSDRRWRVVFPHHPHLSAQHYATCIKKFVKHLGLRADACSERAAQGQMLPIAFDDYVPSVYVSEGSIIDLTVYGPTNVVPLSAGGAVDVQTGEFIAAEEVDAFAAWDQTNRQPVDDLSLDDIRTIVFGQDPAMPYPSWIRVGAAIHHQTRGSEDGRDIWHDWSEQADDVYDPEACDKAWDSFARARQGAPVTMRSYMRGVTLPDHRQRRRDDLKRGLLRQIEAADDQEELLHGIPNEVSITKGLTNDDRSLLAQAVKARIGAMNRALYGVSHAPAVVDIRKRMAPRKLDPDTSSAPVELEDDWLDDWVYVQSGDYFCHRLTQRKANPRGFDAEFNRVLAPDAPVLSAAHHAINGPTPVPVVSDRLYLPGVMGGARHPDIIDEGGVLYLNRWSQSSVPEALDPLCWDQKQYEIDARNVSRYFRLLFRDHRERRILMAWLAFVAQNPGKRVNWMPIIQGPQGVGKSLMGDMMRAVLGPLNVGVVDSHILGGEFNGWAAGYQLNVIEELRTPGEKGSSYAVINAIKPLLTNETISVHRKFCDPLPQRNVTSYLSFTNMRDALPIENGDRRLCVIYTFPETALDVAQINRMYPTLYATLYDLINKRPEILAGLARAFAPTQWWPEFDPYGHAPHTAAKDDMRANAAPELNTAVADALADDCVGVDIRSGVISSRHLVAQIQETTGQHMNTRRLSAILAEYGLVVWDGVTRGRMQWNGSKTTIYVRALNKVDTGWTREGIATVLDSTLQAGAEAAFGPTTNTLQDT